MSTTTAHPPLPETPLPPACDVAPPTPKKILQTLHLPKDFSTPLTLPPETSTTLDAYQPTADSLKLKKQLTTLHLQTASLNHASLALAKLVELTNSKKPEVARRACMSLLKLAHLHNTTNLIPDNDPLFEDQPPPKSPPQSKTQTPSVKAGPHLTPSPFQHSAFTIQHSPPPPISRLAFHVSRFLTPLLLTLLLLRPATNHFTQPLALTPANDPSPFANYQEISIHNPPSSEYAHPVPASERPAMPDPAPPSAFSIQHSEFRILSNLIDIPNRRIYPATLTLQNGRIKTITKAVGGGAPPTTFLLPGFIDAHIHIESSMLVPTEFARLALPHGTVATVSDPHEIANVLGTAGIHFMLDNSGLTPLKITFGAPPCVPATPFETAGATLTPEDVNTLLQHDRVGYLAEVMNYPGVIAGDPDLLAKITHAQATKKPIDGHAPALRGQAIPAYFNRGISTDHECFTLDEALEKLAAAPHLHILIREGSAAKNFDALHPLLRSHPQRLMFCSDDKHPHELEEGHINTLVARAIALGHDLFNVLHAACITPVRHYHLPVGTLRVGDPADFIEVADLTTFQVLRTFIDGTLVAHHGQCTLPPAAPSIRPNTFAATPINPTQLALPIVTTATATARANIIEAFDGQLVTARLIDSLPIVNGQLTADPARDLLKLVVLNRYSPAPPAVAFIKGFKLQRGAIASSVAHDSHNIVAVGTTEDAIARAINLVIAEKGGLSLVDGPTELTLPLPIAGILTDTDGHTVAATYRHLDKTAQALANHQGMSAPFMTLSFMALLVIPSLKLSDQGLFDGESFRFIPVLA